MSGRDLVHSEKESLLRTGKLKQGDAISRLVLSKAWTGLRIETDYLLRTKISYGPIEVSTYTIYYMYLSRK